MNSAPRLAISGLPLLHPHVGVGTYTLRLIHALLRAPDAPPFRVLLPADATEARALLPAEICVPVPGRPPARHPLLAAAWWGLLIGRAAARQFPRARFHSPAPLWSPWRPTNTVVTLHDCLYRRFPIYIGQHGFRRWLAHATERYAAGGHLVLTDSTCSQHDLTTLAHIPAGKIRRLYPWVPRDATPDLARAARETVRAKHQLPARFWLYVGGYDIRKNIPFLIRAYAAAHAERPLPPLVLAGTLPTRPHPTLCDISAALAEARLPGGQIVSIGRVAEADMPGLYSAAELLLYPSLYEGFGLPPAEAMAVGTPVLVSNTSSLPEVVPHAASQFSPTDPHALTQKLLAAHADVTQFTCPLNPAFTEPVALRHYLELLAP